MRSLASRLVLVILVLGISPSLLARAQGGAPAWSEPVVLTPGDNVVALSPVAVADAAGHLHAVWTEGETRGSGAIMTAIYYASWDGRNWSLPVDVAAGGSGGNLSFYNDLAVTPDGTLLLSWSDGDQVSLAVAPAEAASSARAWRTMAMGTGYNPTVAVSPDGLLWCLAYWGDARTLVYTCSDDGGAVWTEPAVLWSADQDAGGSSLASLVTEEGELHLVWTENVERRTWQGEAIWHARIEPETGVSDLRQAARSEQLDEPTLDGPNIAACPNGELHIVWNNGVGSDTGRFHQWYNPEGGRWSQVAPIFAGLSGQTSKPGLVCDNTGRLHLLTSAQGGEAGGGLHYATWLDGTWSDYVTLWGGAHAGERPSMAILGGDELHLLWHLFVLEGEKVDMIAHTYRGIEAEAEEPVAIERPAPAETPSPTPAATLANTPSPTIASASGQPAGHRAATVSPLLISMAAVLPVLAAALWIARGKRR